MEPRPFEQLVDAHYGDLFRFAFSLARNPHDAADLTQQTFTVFAHKGDSIRDPGKRKSWLFTTLYREFIRQGTRTKRVVTMDESDLEFYSPPVAATAARTAEQTELLEALASLPEGQRAVLTLFYLDDIPYKDIAEILDLPIGTVMSRLSRAKESLRLRWQNGPAKGINPTS